MTRYMTCECGTKHPVGAPFCERCGAQPPRRFGTGRNITVRVPDADVPEFLSACEALNEALLWTLGKWGVA